MCQHTIHQLDVRKLAQKNSGELYRRLTTEGVLDKGLLDILWADCKSIKDEVAELMVLYGLLVPLLDKAQGPFSRYMVSSLLPDPAHAEEPAGILAHC